MHLLVHHGQELAHATSDLRQLVLIEQKLRDLIVLFQPFGLQRDFRFLNRSQPWPNNDLLCSLGEGSRF